MRLAVVSFSLGWIAVPFLLSTVQADDASPIGVFVAVDRCPIRSGPGDDHYVTDHAERGVELEVHQRAPGGWLAIRPPSSSFSWVAERELAPTAVTGVFSVVGSSAVSWIGSNVADVADHKWLVKLQEGEPLSVLGKQRLKVVAGGKSDVYCKISPPAGEFRWVHEDDIAHSKDELAQRDEQVELADFRVAVRSSSQQESPQGENAASKADKQVPRTVNEKSQPPAARKKDDFMGRSFKGKPLSEPSKQSVPAPRRDNADQRTLPLGGSGMQLEGKLRELEANLSLIVAQPADKWDFADLRQETEQLSSRAASTLERARIQVFLDKVKDFEQLKSRHALFTPIPPTAAVGVAASAKRSPSGEAAAGRDLDPRFDGTGWLLPVHSTKRFGPPYALLDKEGIVLHFVSPAPGLNLNRYLRKEVGIFGQQEQTPAGDKPHLTAHRVIELDRHRSKR